MGDVIHIDIVSRLKQAAEAKTAANPMLVKALLAGGVGVLGGGALMHAHDQSALEQARTHAQNTGFGAGVATGMAGPQIIDALHAITHRGEQ